MSSDVYYDEKSHRWFYEEDGEFIGFQESPQDDYYLKNVTHYHHIVFLPKQETIEEVERNYSEEEVLTLIRKYQDKFGAMSGNSFFVTEWFEKFKKK